MFRVDGYNTVDDKMFGKLAEYNDYSSGTNCTAEVLTCILGSHILIIPKRDI